jgi:hypothetical protein
MDIHFAISIQTMDVHGSDDQMDLQMMDLQMMDLQMMDLQMMDLQMMDVHRSPDLHSLHKSPWV